MAASPSRKALSWTIAGVVVAVLGIAVKIFWPAGNDTTQTQSGPGNQQAGSGNIIVGGDYIQEFKEEVRGRSREEAEKIAEKYADLSPKPGEPAPFVVIDAPRHLWVRSTGTADGHHIGAVRNGSTVWVDCLAVTGFDPDQTDDFGDTWLRIRWHTDRPNDDIASSQPSGRFQGWIYAGLTLPAGHNGKIPGCG